MKGTSKEPSPAGNRDQIEALRAAANQEAQLGPDPGPENALDLSAAQHGETPIDEDVREQLTARYQHIRTKAELNRAEASNIAVAVAWLRENPYGTTQDLLNQPALRALHRRMFNEVWTWAGQTRTRDTNLGVEPVLIVQQWEDLLRDTHWWIDHNVYPPLEIGLRLHRGMLAIHCFPNGNGRHARITATELARLLGQGPGAYTWGARSGADPEISRREYLRALRLADSEGEYGPLMEIALS